MEHDEALRYHHWKSNTCNTSNNKHPFKTVLWAIYNLCITTQLSAEGKGKNQNRRPVAGRNNLVRIGLGDQESKSRIMVRGPHKQGSRWTPGWKNTEMVCLAHYLPARVTHTAAEEQEAETLSQAMQYSHGGFPAGSRNSSCRRWDFRACCSGSLIETGKGLNSSPLPPMAM